MIEENAKITRTFIGYEGHGIPTATVALSGPTCGQGTPCRDLRHECNILWHLPSVIGVKSWDDLTGQVCRVRRDERGLISEIGHTIENKWCAV